MTEENAKKIIKLSLPAGLTDADTIASAVLQHALTKCSRKRGVDFNREIKSATLTANKQSYILGSDIFSGQGNIWNMQEMWFTDAAGHIVIIMGLDDFNDRSAGGTTTGRPTIATIHSANRTLELYPIPDSNYPFKAYVTKKITQLSDLSDVYHDIPVDIAGLVIKAATDPNVQMQLVREGLADLMVDSGGGWTGSKIALQRHLAGGSTTRATSYNLTGE